MLFQLKNGKITNARCMATYRFDLGIVELLAGQKTKTTKPRLFSVRELGEMTVPTSLDRKLGHKELLKT